MKLILITYITNYLLKDKMKKNFFIPMMALAFIFSACSDYLDKEPGNESNGAISKASASTIVWNGASDKAVAVNVEALLNTTRKNASGAKITSNAHSADFPGIYFIWDTKQKDPGYLKVAAWVFDEYLGFTLTSKESNTYWDFPIHLEAGQNMTDDGCYVFFIPKVVEKDAKGKFFNINMVFIGEFLKKVPKETPILGDADEDVKGIISFQKIVKDDKGNVVPFEDWKGDAGCFKFAIYDGLVKIAENLGLNGEGKLIFESEKIVTGKEYTITETIAAGCVDKFEIAENQLVTATGKKQTIVIVSSGNDKGAVEVNSLENSWSMPGSSVDIKTFWNNTLKSSYLAVFNDMMAIKTKGGKSAQWIWDRSDSWAWGESGSEIILYTKKIFIDGNIIPRDAEWSVPVYFACDNAAIVYVNGQFAGLTEDAFANRLQPRGPMGSFRFINNLSDNAFNGNVWQRVYYAEIAPFLKQGDNEIVFYAANSERVIGNTQNNYYDVTNNPAGLIFACKFNTYKASVDGEFVNVMKPQIKFGPSYASVTATNDVNNPLIVPNANHFTYAKLSKATLLAGITLDLVVGNNIEKVGEAFVKLVNGKIEITYAGAGEFGAVAFETLPEPANGNIHSMDIFKHNNNAVISCPDSDIVYLYIHFKEVKFYI